MEMYVQTWRLFTTEQTKASWFCSPSKAFTFPFHRKLSCYRSQIKPCQCASVGNYSYVLRVSRESNQVAIDFYVGQTETPTTQPIKRSIINTLHPLLLLMDDAAAHHEEAKHSRKKESQKSGGLVVVCLGSELPTWGWNGQWRRENVSTPTKKLPSGVISRVYLNVQANVTHYAMLQMYPRCLLKYLDISFFINWKYMQARFDCHMLPTFSPSLILSEFNPIFGRWCTTPLGDNSLRGMIWLDGKSKWHHASISFFAILDVVCVSSLIFMTQTLGFSSPHNNSLLHIHQPKLSTYFPVNLALLEWQRKLQFMNVGCRRLCKLPGQSYV